MPRRGFRHTHTRNTVSIPHMESNLTTERNQPGWGTNIKPSRPWLRGGKKFSCTSQAFSDPPFCHQSARFPPPHHHPYSQAQPRCGSLSEYQRNRSGNGQELAIRCTAWTQILPTPVKKEVALENGTKDKPNMKHWMQNRTHVKHNRTNVIGWTRWNFIGKNSLKKDNTVTVAFVMLIYSLGTRLHATCWRNGHVY